MATDDDQQVQQKPRRGTVLCNRRVDGPYTVLPNAIVQGADLAPEPFRLLAYIASLPEDWNLRIEQAAKQCRMGRDRTYNALGDLEELNLARLMAVRASNGRIVRRWWEFTLTPGQWKAPNPEIQEMGGGVHILDFRKRRKAPNPETQEKAKRPFPDPPDMASRTLQSNKSTKSDPNGGGRWPFPQDADVTVRIGKLGVDPEVVWQQYLTTNLANPPKNLPAYLVGIARRMAKQAHGKPSSTKPKRFCSVDEPNHGSNGQASMGAALNPEIAFAERNITITSSGKLIIGEQFRTELREAFTDAQIDGALDCTLAAMGSSRDKTRIASQVRRQCVYRKTDAAKGQKPAKPFKPTRYP